MSGCLAAPLEKENEMPAEGIDLERLAKIPVATLTQVMQGIGLPVWARGFHGGSGYRALYAADFDNPVRCGGVTVMVGDYVVADGDGGVVIPPELVEEVMAAALEIEHKEVFIREKVQEGHPTATAYPPSGQLLDEYEEWRNTHPLE
jgi:hypothetical protein